MPNEDSIIHLFGITLLEQNDYWGISCAHYMTLATINQISDKQ
jgi:hypothetical protein